MSTEKPIRSSKNVKPFAVAGDSFIIRIKNPVSGQFEKHSIQVGFSGFVGSNICFVGVACHLLGLVTYQFPTTFNLTEHGPGDYDVEQITDWLIEDLTENLLDTYQIVVDALASMQ